MVAGDVRCASQETRSISLSLPLSPDEATSWAVVVAEPRGTKDTDASGGQRAKHRVVVVGVDSKLEWIVSTAVNRIKVGPFVARDY